MTCPKPNASQNQEVDIGHYLRVLGLFIVCLSCWNSYALAADVEGHEAVTCNSKHKYALELIYEPSAQTSIDALGEMAIWSMEVDEVLKAVGYRILETHHYHNPTVLDLPCPSSKIVEKIFQLLKDNDLAVPHSCQFRRHNPEVDSPINLLLSIEHQDSGIILSGAIPAKSLTDTFLDQPLHYHMRIKDPAGNTYFSNFTQHAAKPMKRCYPLDFAPEADSLIIRLHGEYPFIFIST
ncbi:MAG: hypothetical protein U5L00_20005 [Desulfovermiculus sp.]|nr:hypothetical protein [Desulfovermiculus sp.]